MSLEASLANNAGVVGTGRRPWNESLKCVQMTGVKLTFNVDAQAQGPLALLDPAVVVLVAVAVEGLGAAPRLDELLHHLAEATDLLEAQHVV